MGMVVRLIFCSLFSYLLPVSIKCEITKKPRNTMASFGETSVLQCCSDVPNSNLQWKRYVDGLPQRITLCPDEHCQDSGYLIDKKDPGCSNLIVVYDSASQAGLYHCEEEVDTKQHRAGAYLIVLNLNCRSNSTNQQKLIEGADVLLTCTTTWTGGSHLSISWANEYGVILSRTEFTKSQNTYLSTLRVTLQRPELRQYTATVQFLNTDITDPEIDRSTPMVNWSSAKKNVAYPVTDLQTGCKNDYCERQIEDTIFCGALGYPRPEIRWFNENDELLGERLKISSSGEQRFNCVATNTVGEKTYTAFRVIKVVGTQSENTKSLLQIQETLLRIYRTFYAAVALVTCTAVIFVAVKVFSCLKGRKKMSLSDLIQCVTSLQRTPPPTEVSNDPDEREEMIPLQTQRSNENDDGDADVVVHSNRKSKFLSGKKESFDGDQSTGNIAQAVDESENETTGNEATENEATV